eukprot:CAMPEP_0202701678 /NCGR_PEP_ID=MMETSP1385-20130828/14746_1 /ASSEMBLY_ACC=CAM_ASM_000861 /TAXON_ID=933848 /ORGANISM="Elphidium margaritaceum" /LENGTH=795 /DNA_ID=CAMNT_0049359151 /DNA_START=131 /DNA_END=2519 /DNA_ORIENTATION=+
MAALSSSYEDIDDEDGQEWVSYVSTRKCKAGTVLSAGEADTFVALLEHGQLHLLDGFDLGKILRLCAVPSAATDDVEQVPADEVLKKYCQAVPLDYHQELETHLAGKGPRVDIIANVRRFRASEEEAKRCFAVTQTGEAPDVEQHIELTPRGASEQRQQHSASPPVTVLSNGVLEVSPIDHRDYANGNDKEEKQEEKGSRSGARARAGDGTEARQSEQRGNVRYIAWDCDMVPISDADVVEFGRAAQEVWNERHETVAATEQGAIPVDLWTSLADAFQSVPLQLLRVMEETTPKPIKMVTITILRRLSCDVDELGGIEALIEVAIKRARKKLLEKKLKAAQRKRKADEAEIEELPAPVPKQTRLNNGKRQPVYAGDHNTTTTTTTAVQQPNDDQQHQPLLETTSNTINTLVDNNSDHLRRVKDLDSTTRALYGDWVADISTKQHVVAVLMSEKEMVSKGANPLATTITNIVNGSNAAVAANINNENEEQRTTKSKPKPNASRVKLVCWLVCDNRNKVGSYLSFAVDVHKYLNEMSYLSSGTILKVFEKPDTHIELFEQIRKWLSQMTAELDTASVQSVCEVTTNEALKVANATTAFANQCVVELDNILRVLKQVKEKYRPSAQQWASYLQQVQHAYITSKKLSFYGALQNPLYMREVQERVGFQTDMDTRLTNAIESYEPLKYQVGVPLPLALRPSIIHGNQSMANHNHNQSHFGKPKNGNYSQHKNRRSKNGTGRQQNVFEEMKSRLAAQNVPWVDSSVPSTISINAEEESVVQDNMRAINAKAVTSLEIVEVK